MANKESTQIKTSYDLPTGIEAFTPEEAASTLKGIYAASINSSHPLHYSQGSHYQHKDFMDVTAKLHEIKCGPVEEAQEDKLAIEANEFLAEKQALLVQEAETLVDDMATNHNFARKEIPPDISDWQIRAWRMQKSLAQEKYTEVASAIQTELRAIGADAETISSVNVSMMDGNFSERYRGKYLRSLIDDILIVYRKREASPRTNFGEQMQKFGGV